MKRKIVAIIMAAAITLSFTACMDTGNDNTSSSSDSSSKTFRDNVNKVKKELKEGVDSIKENAKEVVDSIKEDFNSSPLGKVKEGVDDVKEIVSDVKEIKDAIKDEARTPLKASKCKGENYEKIQKEFENAGFKNVSAKGNGKLKVGLLHDEGDVESVSINGKEKFDKGDNFSEDAEIIITYYSKS